MADCSIALLFFTPKMPVLVFYAVYSIDAGTIIACWPATRAVRLGSRYAFLSHDVTFLLMSDSIETAVVPKTFCVAPSILPLLLSIDRFLAETVT